MRKFLFGLLSGFILLGAVSAIHTSVADERTAGDNKKNDYSETYRYLNLFGDVFERVRAQYVEPVEDKKLVEAAVSGLLANLDPHSAYLNEDSFEDMRVSTRGEFGGLGIEVTMESGFVKVVSPIDDTPAFEAGVQAGDFITHIDEEAVLGLSLSEAVEKMRGKVGTEIKITVRREGEAEAIDYVIVRDVIKIRSVRHRIEGNAGYLRVTTFNQNTESGVKKAIAKIKEELGENMQGLVLDLRNNPGGLLSQAIGVSDVFLDKGEIVSTRSRNDQDTKRDNATPGDLLNGLPMVVLINGGSASASEIVAGALQDHKRSILLGTKSFGKGSVQTVIPLPGHGAMKLTTARYFTPSGRSIQATGIEPDIIVEPAKIETLEAGRSFRESDYHGALDNDKKKDKAANDNKKDKDKKDDDKPKDYQLIRALDLLNGLSLYNEADSIPTKSVTATTAP